LGIFVPDTIQLRAHVVILLIIQTRLCLKCKAFLRYNLLKQSRDESTPIIFTSQSQAIYGNIKTNFDTDIKKIVSKLNDIINNQITINNTLTAFRNIFELEKML